MAQLNLKTEKEYNEFLEKLKAKLATEKAKGKTFKNCYSSEYYSLKVDIKRYTAERNRLN